MFREISSRGRVKSAGFGERKTAFARPKPIRRKGKIQNPRSLHERIGIGKIGISDRISSE